MEKYITKLNLKAYNVSKATFSSLRIYDCCYSGGYGDLSYCKKNRTQKIKFKKKMMDMKRLLKKKYLKYTYFFIYRNNA